MMVPGSAVRIGNFKAQAESAQSLPGMIRVDQRRGQEVEGGVCGKLVLGKGTIFTHRIVIEEDFVVSAGELFVEEAFDSQITDVVGEGRFHPLKPRKEAMGKYPFVHQPAEGQGSITVGDDSPSGILDSFPGSDTGCLLPLHKDSGDLLVV